MRMILIAIFILGVSGCGDRVNTPNKDENKTDTILNTPSSPSTQDREKQPPSLPVI